MEVTDTVDDWKRWPSQFARDRKVAGKGGLLCAVMNCL